MNTTELLKFFRAKYPTVQELNNIPLELFRYNRIQYEGGISVDPNDPGNTGGYNMTNMGLTSVTFLENAAAMGWEKTPERFKSLTIKDIDDFTKYLWKERKVDELPKWSDQIAYANLIWASGDQGAMTLYGVGSLEKVREGIRKDGWQKYLERHTAYNRGTGYSLGLSRGWGTNDQEFGEAKYNDSIWRMCEIADDKQKKSTGYMQPWWLGWQLP